MDEKSLLFILNKIISSKQPAYLYMLCQLQRSQRNKGFFEPLLCRTEIFKSSFFTIYNKRMKQTKSMNQENWFVGKFSKKLKNLKIIKSTEDKTFRIYDSLGIKLLNSLRVDFSHQSEYKLRHNFADTSNPLCSCSLETESMTLPKLN